MKIKDLLHKTIYFKSISGKYSNSFPNSDFKDTFCTIEYNDENENKFYDYVILCSEGNGYLCDGEEEIQCFLKDENPEYFL